MEFIRSWGCEQMKKKKAKKKIKKMSWQRKLKEEKVNLEKRLQDLERTLKNVRLNTGLECPLCQRFESKVFPHERMIIGMMSLEGKRIRHFYKCKNCDKTWD